MNIRTDLAVEIKEQYKEDNIEIEGVILEEKYIHDKDIKITLVDIINEHGQKAMSRPMGKYITIENIKGDISQLQEILKVYLEELTCYILEKKILVVGLGNRDVTPDSLGPLTVEQIDANRHILKELYIEGEVRNDIKNIAAIAPGVMGQTGIEAQEMIKALINELDINIVIAIDALAARNINRVNNTIQLTNTGICPGAGVGNNRKELNKDTLGVDVIAIGVPTVVDAATIVYDTLEHFMTNQGLDKREIEEFNNEIKKENIMNMFVTPKDIDECIVYMSRIIAQSINEF